MAKNTQPILKRCKTLGIDPTVVGVSQNSIRNPKPGRRKQSEYGLQLNEKQKAKLREFSDISSDKDNEQSKGFWDKVKDNFK